MRRRFFVLCRGAEEHRLLAGAYTLGRSSECDLPLSDPRASRVHALIRVQDDGAVLQDAGSSNGTSVNGQLVERPQVLRDGDQIQIGDTLLVLREVEQLPDAGRRRPSRDETLRHAALPPRAAEAQVSEQAQAGVLAALSQREREVLERVARGYTHKEIAEQLALSPKTVEGYRARVSEKLGVKSRAELVELALRHKLLG